MSVQVENMEKNLAKMTIQVSAEDLENAIQKAYLKNKKSFNIPGFRKGKVPRQLIEKTYGPEVFYEDAVNELLPSAYSQAAKESGLDIVSRPEINVTSVKAGEGVVFTAVVAVKPEVTLGQYKGVETAKVDTAVTEEEVMAEIAKEQEKNAVTVTVEDRAAQLNDTVTIDFEGFIDGVAFDGGKGEDYDLVLGSHSFIDTFEDQLVGKNVGDEVEVNVTFPAEYHVEDLKNKPAMFKVAVKAIKAKEIPALDDDFASDVSEFDTLDEYKVDVQKKLEEKKAQDAKLQKEEDVLNQIIENSQMEIPDQMVTTQAENMVDEYAQRMQSQGISMQMYLQYTGMTEQQLLDQMKPQAINRIQSRLVLEAIAQAENLTVTDEDVDKECASMGEAYGMEAAKVKELLGEDGLTQMKEDLAVQKAADFIVEESVEVEAAAEE
jgi:trigger factor